eukprot:SAG31_NODE_2505_length_5592_cov_2.644639_5_plen_78_part_00
MQPYEYSCTGSTAVLNLALYECSWDAAGKRILKYWNVPLKRSWIIVGNFPDFHKTEENRFMISGSRFLSGSGFVSPV